MVRKTQQLTTYEKVYVTKYSLSGAVGEYEPGFDPTKQIEEEVYRDQLLSKFEGVKREIIRLLMDGENFYQASKILQIKESQAYKIKRELMQEFQWLYDEQKRNKVIKANESAIKLLIENTKQVVEQMSLADFISCYIYDYDPEAQTRSWRTTQFQNTLEQIWETNRKSCTLAPREHLKTSTVLAYLIKKIYTRKFPLEINYYHLTEDLAIEKFRKLKRVVENNPLLSGNFLIDEKINWKEDLIQLRDGTVIQPMSYKEGSVGKHPHIIVLDDIIDRTVIYSDTQNQKSIDKFYSDIYPQISKVEQDKQIIVIGTAQRKDDLYHSLPGDFVFNVFRAVISDDKQEVLSPELFSYGDLMKIKKDISEKNGERYWLKEYQNSPFEALGLIIRPEWIKRYHQLPTFVNKDGEEVEIKTEKFQGWDLSVGKDVEKGDWTVGITIAVDRSGDKPKIYCRDLRRERINFGQRLTAIVEEFNKHKPLLIGVEDVAFQYDTVQTLKEKTLLPIRSIKAIKNKIESFQTELSPYFENSQIYIPYGEEWDQFVNELLSLPAGEFDDRADALKIAIKTALIRNEPNIRVLR